MAQYEYGTKNEVEKTRYRTRYGTVLVSCVSAALLAPWLAGGLPPSWPGLARAGARRFHLRVDVPTAPGPARPPRRQPASLSLAGRPLHSFSCLLCQRARQRPRNVRVQKKRRRHATDAANSSAVRSMRLATRSCHIRRSCLAITPIASFQLAAGLCAPVAKAIALHIQPRGTPAGIA